MERSEQRVNDVIRTNADQARQNTGFEGPIYCIKNRYLFLCYRDAKLFMRSTTSLLHRSSYIHSYSYTHMVVALQQQHKFKTYILQSDRATNENKRNKRCCKLTCSKHEPAVLFVTRSAIGVFFNQNSIVYFIINMIVIWNFSVSI